jgi:hypothetical protein
MLRDGHQRTKSLQEDRPTMTVRRTPDDGGAPGDVGRATVAPETSARAASCEADPRCTRAACFQVQLEASRPEQAHRQASACAYHVADVIEALRAWARDQGLGGGQLTILAIESVAGGHQACGASGPNTAALREFAFTTIPLKTIPPGSVHQGG